MDGLAERTNLWIARSQSYPLTFHFRHTEGISDAGRSSPSFLPRVKQAIVCKVQPLVDLLCAHSARWQDIHLELRIGTMRSPLLSLITQPLPPSPILRQISFTLLFEPSDEREELTRLKETLHSSIEIFQSLSLRRLCLISPWTDHTNLSINFSKLTTVIFSDCPPSFVLSLLRLCPQLRICDLSLKPPGSYIHLEDRF